MVKRLNRKLLKSEKKISFFAKNIEQIIARGNQHSSNICAAKDLLLISKAVVTVKNKRFLAGSTRSVGPALFSGATCLGIGTRV